MFVGSNNNEFATDWAASLPRCTKVFTYISVTVNAIKTYDWTGKHVGIQNKKTENFWFYAH